MNHHHHANRNTPARTGAAGVIILLVILIAIAIAAYLIAMPGGTADQAKQATDTAQNLSIDLQARSLAQAVTAHRLQNNAYPAAIGDLSAAPAAFEDPWGTQLRFTIDTDATPNTITVRSAGPDARWNTPDDRSTERPLSF
jgi:hypothetical protein